MKGAQEAMIRLMREGIQLPSCTCGADEYIHLESVVVTYSPLLLI